MGGSNSTVNKPNSSKRNLAKIDTEMVSNCREYNAAIGALDLTPLTPESASGGGSTASSPASLLAAEASPPGSPSSSSSSSSSAPTEPPTQVMATTGWVDPIKVFKQRVIEAEVLKSIPGMPNASNETYLMCIAQAMKVEYWDEGGGSSLIIEEGTLATRCYVVLDGTVSIVATTGDEGWPQEKGKKTAMEYFGDEALVREADGSSFKDNQRYSYSAVVAEDESGYGDGVTLLCLDVSKLRLMLEMDPADVVAEDKARRSEKAVAKANNKMSQIRRTLSAARG
jgi:hypothetical protein